MGGRPGTNSGSRRCRAVSSDGSVATRRYAASMAGTAPERDADEVVGRVTPTRSTPVDQRSILEPVRSDQDICGLEVGAWPCT